MPTLYLWKTYVEVGAHERDCWKYVQNAYTKVSSAHRSSELAHFSVDQNYTCKSYVRELSHDHA